MNIVLYEPEIPPNTGNIARLCAGLDLTLHLVEPLGFSLDDRQLKRAGLDYWPLVKLRVWPDWAAFRREGPPGRLVATSARDGDHFSAWRPLPSDNLLMGSETRGLPDRIAAEAELVLHIPMRPGVRSLNLATTTGFFLGVAYSKLAESAPGEGTWTAPAPEAPAGADGGAVDG